jgi:hypothetical protein
MKIEVMYFDGCPIHEAPPDDWVLDALSQRCGT